MKLWLKWFVLIFASLVVWVVVQLPDDKLHVVFCDVGQGDAQLIVKGEVQILIDGGSGGAAVLECLASKMPFWDRTIEMVVNTHPEKDHLGGLDDVMERYRVGKLLLNKVENGSADYQKLIAVAEAKKVSSYQPQRGDVLKVAGLELAIVWPTEERRENEAELNGMSIVIRLKYGQFEALFSGDIGEAEELALVGSGVITQVTVLKVPHHGSKYSSSLEFVGQLRPKLAVIGVGAKNSYGHPNGDTLNRYDMVGAKVMRTDKDGTVEVVTDGSRWWIH